MNENPQVQSPAPLFLHIPVSRLILLSIVSFGAYESYWMYKNWRYLKARTGINVTAFWRGVFGYFFCHSLLRRIHQDTDARSIQMPTFSPIGLATGWVILRLAANIGVNQLEDTGPIVAAAVIAALVPSYLFLVPVQNYINSVEDKRRPAQQFYRWSFGHIVCLTLGIIVWALVLLGEYVL